METTIDLRELLARYRAANAAWIAEDARYDAEEKAREKAEELRLLIEDRRRTAEEIDASNARLNAHVATWNEPVEVAAAHLRAACCILHGVSPTEKQLDRPRVVALDGALLVVLPLEDCQEGRGFKVVEPGDVLAIAPAPPAAEAPPRPRRKRKAPAR